jgi:hypothetical protein
MAALRALDYPWPSLDHRGGDVMLGEALVQSGLTAWHYHDNAAINADATGRDGEAKRRGFDNAPIGTVMAATLPPRAAALISPTRPAQRRRVLPEL